jgi:hypothetical protein
MSEAAATHDRDPVFLTPAELAARWKVSRAVLTRWRLKKCGPEFVQLGPKGGAIVYELEVIERYERAHTVSTGAGEARP